MVPGDPSSAAFLVVTALITEGSDVTIENVMINPLRAGIFECLKEMGANLEIYNERLIAGERIADIRAIYSELKGITVPKERAPSMIDEYPILSVAAAFADGQTIMDGIGELRVKESDRIKLMADGLTACGVDVEEGPEKLVVNGKGAGNKPNGGVSITTHGDHRIAMSFSVASLRASAPIRIHDCANVATSFPNFLALSAEVGINVAVEDKA